jgi:predicted metalloprotease with PDZ domain
MDLIYYTSLDKQIQVKAILIYEEIKNNEFYFARWRLGRYELQNFEKACLFSKIYLNETEIYPTLIDISHYHIKEKITKNDKITIISYFRAENLNAGNHVYNTESLINILPILITPYTESVKIVNLSIESNPSLICLSTLKIIDKIDHLTKYEPVDLQVFFDTPIILVSPHKLTKIKLNTKYKANISLNIISEKVYITCDTIKNKFEDFINKIYSKLPKLPVEEYAFYLILENSNIYHGLEHLNSTVITLGNKNLDIEQNETLIKDIVHIACHEFIHIWNAKTLKPEELLPPLNYQKPILFSTCFITEGLTEYLACDILKSETEEISETVQFYIKKILQLEEKSPNFYSLADYSINLWRDGYSLEYFSAPSFIYIKAPVIAYFLDKLMQKHYKTNIWNYFQQMYTKRIETGYNKETLIGDLTAITNDEEFSFNFIEKYFYSNAYLISEELEKFK